MAYHIYHTEAIVLATRDFSEADKIFFLLTEQFGLVAASARGVRLLSSKLRYALREKSVCLVDLVRGRDMWRIVNAYPSDKSPARLSPAGALFLGRMSALVLRLVRGEGRNTSLYAVVREALSFAAGDMPEGEMLRAEAAAGAKILHALGYWPEKHAGVISAPLRDAFGMEETVRREIVREINASLRESHL